MSKKLISTILIICTILLSSFVIPTTALAQNNISIYKTNVTEKVPPCSFVGLNDLDSAFMFADDIVRCAMPILVMFALLYFVWGVVELVLYSRTGSDKFNQAKKKVAVGIIGLFVILSIWGIIAVIANTIGVGIGDSLKPPGTSGIFIETVV